MPDSSRGLSTLSGDATVTTSTPPAMRTVAVVLAGGTGARVGFDLPKQLLKVAGRTIIEHTVKALHDCDEIDEILVVMASDFVPDVEQLLLDNPLYPRLTRIISGGDDRTASTREAIDAIGAEECNVLFHDAVRPLLTPRVVAECVTALRTFEAVDVAISATDTIIEVNADDTIADIPDRSRLRRGQTPQGFRLSTIRRAYERAAADPDFRATDNCGVVLRYLPEVPIKVVIGDEQNMKVTYPIDLYLADRLFQVASQFSQVRSQADIADALRDQTVVVFGGSYGIGRDVVRLAEELGCRVFGFSRSTTGTYVENEASVVQALEQVAAETGRIDAVVVTAAQLAKGRLTEMPEDEIQAQVQVNYLGPVLVARAAEPYLRRSKGHLVLFTSSSYTRGRADYALYSSTKAAVVNLAQGLADEWSDCGIHVNVINPERTRTAMRLRSFGAEPKDSLLEGETVALAVLNVLTADVTGQVIDVRREPGWLG